MYGSQSGSPLPASKMDNPQNDFVGKYCWINSLSCSLTLELMSWTVKKKTLLSW